MRIPKTCRLTIDLDSKNQLNLLKVIFNTKYIFPNAKIEVYESRKGYHLYILPPSSLSFEQRLNLRLFLGDDPDRCFLDYLRLRYGFLRAFEAIFMVKKIGRKVVSREVEFNALR